MSDPPSQHPPGSLPEIRGYKLSRVVGSGGMSTIYLGKQVALQREVAIKVMLPEALADETSRRRFENEARTIARLDHPHIVGIHEVGRTEDGLPYYAMPYLPRGHLGQRTFAQDGHEHGHARVRAILADLLSALEYAHARGVVHRDVKSENVLFDEAERPLLADFGIALRRGFGSRVTTAGMAVGSTAYMAPEQARGDEVDARADLYSVGVLAWEMLTGHLPYVAGDALSMAIKHAQDPIPRLPDELRHWQRFIDRALAKSPGHRFHDAAQMRAALDRVPGRGGMSLARASHGMRRALGAIRRWPRMAWIAIALVAAAGIGIGLRQLPEYGGSRFFRVAGDDGDPQPSPDGRSAQGILDVAERMLRPLPVSPAERWIAAADGQRQQGKLIAPEDGNAYDSLVAGWKADPSNPDLPAASAGLIAALADAAVRRIDAADDPGARNMIRHAQGVAMLATQPDGAAMIAMRRRVADAYGRRVDAAASRYDRRAAQAVVALARTSGLDRKSIAVLDARANAIPQPGETLDDASGLRVLHAGKHLIAMSQVEVSRGDYARFANATRRPTALCRQRTSLLRIIKPISWRSPGFEQTPQQPVVCVSWSDADAYARWLGKRDGHDYRLPTAAEARLLAPENGKRPVAEWLRECGKDCRERMAGGRSWREPAGNRALDPTRGYDDVGFRLVRELPAGKR